MVVDVVFLCRKRPYPPQSTMTVCSFLPQVTFQKIYCQHRGEAILKTTFSKERVFTKLKRFTANTEERSFFSVKENYTYMLYIHTYMWEKVFFPFSKDFLPTQRRRDLENYICWRRFFTKLKRLCFQLYICTPSSNKRFSLLKRFTGNTEEKRTCFSTYFGESLFTFQKIYWQHREEGIGFSVKDKI